MKKKILVIIADYYKDISNDLLKSTLNNLNKKHYSIKILKVPGVFEIPVTISRVVSPPLSNSLYFFNSSFKDFTINKKQAIARGKKGLEASEAVKVVLTNK